MTHSLWLISYVAHIPDDSKSEDKVVLYNWDGTKGAAPRSLGPLWCLPVTSFSCLPHFLHLLKHYMCALLNLSSLLLMQCYVITEEVFLSILLSEIIFVGLVLLSIVYQWRYLCLKIFFAAKFYAMNLSFKLDMALFLFFFFFFFILGPVLVIVFFKESLNFIRFDGIKLFIIFP